LRCLRRQRRPFRESAGVLALFHTGQTGIGAGGHGIKLRYFDQMLLDDVAAWVPRPVRADGRWVLPV
jgi:hypothetical protein